VSDPPTPAEQILPELPVLPDVRARQRLHPTEPLRRDVCAMLERGESITATCKFTGISIATFHNWRKRGEDLIDRARLTTSGVPRPEQDYVRWALEVNRARAITESRLRALAEEGAKKDGRVALMMLERMFPASWSERSRLEVTGAEGGPIEIMPARELIRQHIEQTSERLRNGLHVVDVTPQPELPPAAEG
jgi:hypothetical protein